MEGMPPNRLRTWWNLQQPDATPGEYPDIYPHRHAISPGVTCILYLDPGDATSALEVLTDDLEVADTIVPEAGLAVIIPNGVWHRVYKNRGTRDRIALIAEGYP